MSAPAFIHLRVRSTYSLLEGAIPVKDLIKWCKKNSMPAVALTDTANLFASLEFSLAGKEAGVQPIQASMLPIKPWHVPDIRHAHQQKPDQLLVYAKDEMGWKNLLALSSQSYLQPAEQPGPLLSLEDLAAHSDGLIVLTGGIYGAIGKSLIAGNDAAAEAYLLQLIRIYPGRVYIELSRHGLSEEEIIESRLIALAQKHQVPLVATNDCHFIDAEMFEAHDAFLCIADGRYVSETDRRRLTPEHRLKTPEEMCALFSDIPEAISNTMNIARRCAFIAESRAPILPRFTQDGMSEEDALRAQAKQGLEERLQRFVFVDGMSEADKETTAKPYRERLEFELGVIIKMRFPGYFLIVSDFIKWSKAHDIPVGPGRGSGAGSLVAWSLSITDLDPLRYGLLFERFLNPERVSMPDFDVDFCQERREEVIAYVQKRYGHSRVAQIITFGKLQARAVLRDVGRVLQMPYGQVDKISKLVPHNPAHPVTLKEAIEMEPALKNAIREDETVEKLIEISLHLEGLNRHASTHAAGVVIGDRALSELVPMYRDPKSDASVIQYSMKYAESAGLVKFDFLGLKTLTVLVRAVQLLKEQGISVDLLALPEKDKKTYDMLSRGDTVGVFQLESAGMRDTLKKLKPDCLEDIIALVSLYRPGPMDNIPTYIARKHGNEKPEYLHPLLEAVLKETFGVIIYQEQVMQIAQLLAGYSLGEADLLRRAMGKKIRSEMEAQREIFTKRAVERGVDKHQAASIFDLIAKFAEYGFNKSHAAAYAVIAYQTAYIKANYPVEFLAASMTYDMHNTDKLGVFREEAGRFHIPMLPPDMNASQVLFSVENGAIRYALSAVRNVGTQAMQSVVREREQGGVYQDIFDVMARVSGDAMNRRALEHLIKAGAFDTMHKNRKQLFDSIEMIMAYGSAMHRDRESQQVSLFAMDNAPAVPKPTLEDSEDWSALERLEHEFSAIGFYLTAHPLEGYKTQLNKMGVVSSADLAAKLGSQYRMVKVAGIVTGRKFKVSEKGRFAFIQLSDTGGVFEVSVFNEALIGQNRDHLENGKILLVQAEGKQDEAGMRLIAQSIHLFDDMWLQQSKRHSSHVRVVVSQQESLQGLRALLGDQMPHGMHVTLALKIGQEHVELALPGKYAVTPSMIDKLRALRGVTHVEETDQMPQAA